MAQIDELKRHLASLEEQASNLWTMLPRDASASAYRVSVDVDKLTHIVLSLCSVLGTWAAEESAHHERQNDASKNG